jgi:hypothetical protein
MEAIGTEVTEGTCGAYGACGKILSTKHWNVVVKRLHRHMRSTRARCHNAEKQCELQSWAAGLLTPANGFEVLFTPRAWNSPESNQYAMERIDCSQQLLPVSLTGHEMDELKRFYEKAKEAGIFPFDYELYRQSDGRIGLIDFDKFAAWNLAVKTESAEVIHEVLFPWGLIWKPLYPWDE